MKNINIKKVLLVVLVILGCIIRDRNIYVLIPLLLLVLWKEKKEKILYYSGLIGAGYGVLGLSLEGFITNRGIFLMLISIIGQYLYKKKKVEIPYKPIIYTYIFILFGGIVWNLLSPEGITGVGRFISVNKKFIFIILLYNIINTEEKFKRIIDIFIGGVVLTGIYGIYQYINIYNQYGKNLNNIDWYRIPGFTNILYTAAVLMMGSLLLFGKIWDSFSFKNRKDIFYGIGFLISSLGLLLTKTRACIIGYILGTLLIIILKRNLKKTLLLLGILLGIFLITPKPIKENIFERVSQITFKENNRNENTASDNLRRVMWRGSIYAWENNKIFGVGSRGTGKWLQEYADKNTDEKGMVAYGVTRSSFTFQEAHCMYLNYLSEVGLFSLSYLILLFIIIPKLILKIYRAKKQYEGEFLGVIGAILAYYFLGTVWSVWGYFGTTQEVFQFMIFILIYIYKNKSQDI